MYLGIDHLSSSCLGFSALFGPIYLFPSPGYRIFHLLAFQINSLFLYSSLHFKTLIMQIVLLMLSQRQLKLSLFLLILFNVYIFWSFCKLLNNAVVQKCNCKIHEVGMPKRKARD